MQTGMMRKVSLLAISCILISLVCRHADASSADGESTYIKIGTIKTLRPNQGAVCHQGLCVKWKTIHSSSLRQFDRLLLVSESGKCLQAIGMNGASPVGITRDGKVVVEAVSGDQYAVNPRARFFLAGEFFTASKANCD